MVMDADGRSVAAESVLQLREANFKHLHHPNVDGRASESSDDEQANGNQVKTNRSK
jgi:hypothetical protein